MIKQDTRLVTFRKKNLSERQKDVLTSLGNSLLTANELAYVMYVRNLIPGTDRNYVHPRLTELVSMRLVDVLYDKRTCSESGRTCTVYKVVGND